MSNDIFVFGSNLRGIHGAGSAAAALASHGAVWGEGIGHYGKSYAIPTKGKYIEVLPIQEIACHVSNFLKFASHRPEWKFNIVDIGCGLAGFKVEDIAPLFKGAGDNCNFVGKLKGFV